VATLDESAAVRRLHDRLGFGPRPGDLATGFAATATALLNPTPDAVPAPNLGAPVARPGKDAAARKQAAQALAQQELTLVGWWLDRMVTTIAPLAERLTWFWHGHFATSEQKVRSPQLMLRQNETFRQQGLGDFTRWPDR